MADNILRNNEKSTNKIESADPSFDQLEKKHSKGLTFIYALENLSPSLRNTAELKHILEQSPNFSTDNLAELTHLLTESAVAVRDLEQKIAHGTDDIHEPLAPALEILADRLSKNDEFLRLALFGYTLPATSVISSIQNLHDRSWLHDNSYVIRDGIYNALEKLEEVVDILNDLKKAS